MFSIFEGVLVLREDFFFLFDNPSIDDFCGELSKEKQENNK